MTERYEPTFESLRKHSVPDWFRDAKLGFWSHWGLGSVPMAGDWYARNMYLQGSRQYRIHLRLYGHPSHFGYKDLIPLWKAERFDPMALMERYVDAGARYFMAQAVHHDSFFNYDSRLQPGFNSVRMGPGKDICRLWQGAARAFHLPFGVSEHLAGTYTWYAPNKGSDSTGPFAGVPYDGRDPAYEELYTDDYEHYDPSDPGRIDPWMTGNRRWQERWLSLIRELTDRFHPDMMYSDNPLAFLSPEAPYSLEAVSCVYNDSIRRHGENRAVYCIKESRRDLYSVGIRDVERSPLDHILDTPWQTDTCVGCWFYDLEQEYKTPEHVIEMLVDIVSKNGCLMLNIPRRPDGAIDSECGYLLDQLSHYTHTCGEGLYGTRPYRVYGEDPSCVTIDGFREERVSWQETDLRFSRKGNTLYVHMMKAPEKRVLTVHSLKNGERVTAARLLGGGETPFQQYADRVCLRLPDRLPTRYVNCAALELKDE